MTERGRGQRNDVPGGRPARSRTVGPGVPARQRREGHPVLFRDRSRGEMGEGPGGADARGDGAFRPVAEAHKAGHGHVQKRPFAAEQMADPGDVEHQIAIGALTVHDRNDGREIGVPVGQPGEHHGKKIVIGLARHRARTDGAGIAQALAFAEPCRPGHHVDRAQPAWRCRAFRRASKGGVFSARLPEPANRCPLRLGTLLSCGRAPEPANRYPLRLGTLLSCGRVPEPANRCPLRLGTLLSCGRVPEPANRCPLRLGTL